MAKTFLTFNIVLGKGLRHYQANMVQKEDEPLPLLIITNIKHFMLEMYSALRTVTTGRLRKMLESLEHYSPVSTWTSGRSFLGVMTCWVEDRKLISSNLAVGIASHVSKL